MLFCVKDFNDEELIQEIRDRNLQGSFINYNGLCDHFGVNYFTPIESLLDLISNDLNSVNHVKSKKT